MPPQPTGKTSPQKWFGEVLATKALDRSFLSRNDEK